MGEEIPPHLVQVVGEAISADDVLRRRAGALASRVMAEAEQLLATGTPKVKEGLVRALLPAITKAMTVEDERDTRFEEMLARFEELQDGFRRAVSDPRPLPTGESDLPVDGHG